MPKTKHLLLTTLLLIAAASAAAGVYALLTPNLPPPAQAAAQQHGESIEAEVVTLTPFGFEPREITRPPGPFLLAVHNQSNSAEVSLRLARVRGERLQEVRLRPGKRRWEQRLALGHGEYLLTEEGRPEWNCIIIIEAR